MEMFLRRVKCLLLQIVGNREDKGKFFCGFFEMGTKAVSHRKCLGGSEGFAQGV